MNYLHQHQIAHLDIKSPNVLVWEFPSAQSGSCHDRLTYATEVLVKIADYGTSQSSTLHGIMANHAVGTPGYMAPELFSHKGQEISPDKVKLDFVCLCSYLLLLLCMKVDVFAFGMTIFELLTTRPPYDEVPQRDANTLHQLVREGRRPLLTEQVNNYDNILAV